MGNTDLTPETGQRAWLTCSCTFVKDNWGLLSVANSKVTPESMGLHFK